MKTDGLQLCQSAAMWSVRETIAKVATANATVLLRGESGVGKEVVARALHQASTRAHKPLLKVNCAALPGELLESELFGHQKGAFTGAYREKPGKFEQAHQGTLMLDEIGEVPLRLQAKLLHVLQDGEFSRVGGEKIVETDVRVVAATNRDLEAAISTGQFREDLYYRLNVIEIRIPPLRERREEIPGLLAYFLRQFNAQFGRSVDVPPETVRVFTDYSWPGNIRELENAVKRMVVLGSARGAHDEILSKVSAGNGGHAVRPMPVVTAAGGDPHAGLKSIARRAARDAERVAIKETLERVHWNRAKAARLLQISYKALLYKIVQCGLVSADEPRQEEVAA
jgi:two-component system response regulator AtoC